MSDYIKARDQAAETHENESVIDYCGDAHSFRHGADWALTKCPIVLSLVRTVERIYFNGAQDALEHMRNAPLEYHAACKEANNETKTPQD